MKLEHCSIDDLHYSISWWMGIVFGDLWYSFCLLYYSFCTNVVYGMWIFKYPHMRTYHPRCIYIVTALRFEFPCLVREFGFGGVTRYLSLSPTAIVGKKYRTTDWKGHRLIGLSFENIGREISLDRHFYDMGWERLTSQWYFRGTENSKLILIGSVWSDTKIMEYWPRYQSWLAFLWYGLRQINISVILYRTEAKIGKLILIGLVWSNRYRLIFKIMVLIYYLIFIL